MTVGELMAKLRQYPADVEIMSKPLGAEGKIVVFVEGNSLDPIFHIPPLEKDIVR